MLPRDEKSFSNLRLKKMLEESTVRLNSWDEIVVARNLLVTLLANSGGPRSVSCYGGSNKPVRLMIRARLFPALSATQETFFVSGVIAPTTRT